MKVLEGDKSQVDIIQEESADSGEVVVSIKLGSGYQIFNPNNEHYLIECVRDYLREIGYFTNNILMIKLKFI